jgi:hypothetical protein
MDTVAVVGKGGPIDHREVPDIPLGSDGSLPGAITVIVGNGRHDYRCTAATDNERPVYEHRGLVAAAPPRPPEAKPKPATRPAVTAAAFIPPGVKLSPQAQAAIDAAKRHNRE